MIVYAVDLHVDAALAGEYLPWLREHVREMLALPGFVDARILERIEPASFGQVLYSVHYRLRERAQLDAYLRDHAPRMRGASARFGDRVRAVRHLWLELE